MRSLAHFGDQRICDIWMKHYTNLRCTEAFLLFKMCPITFCINQMQDTFLKSQHEQLT